MKTDKKYDEINQLLNSRAEDVCRHILPGGKRASGQWRCGGVDGSPGKSLEVDLEGEHAGRWVDRAGGDDDRGGLVKLWMIARGLSSYPSAYDEAADWLGVPRREKGTPKIIDMSNFGYNNPKGTAANSGEVGPTPEPAAPDHDPDPIPESKAEVVDWDSCLVNFTDDLKAGVCRDRGYSAHFIGWLHENEAIGTFKGCIAFPVHNAAGEVVRIHYKTGDSWRYHPKGGGESSPLIVGAPLAHAAEVLAFESQWDAFAVLDKLGAHLEENDGRYCAYITRGASSNNNMSKVVVAKLIACPQNDPAEKASKTTGRTPAEEWLFKIQSTKHKGTAFSVFETPAGHKDANDWIRADKPTGEEVSRLISGAKNPLLKSILSADDLILMRDRVKDDQSSLIGFERRFLGKGGSMLMIGPSGIGKSTLMTSFLCHAAAGIAWNGITFRRPLRVLAIQAENDEGDLSEMMTGIFRDKAVRAQFTPKDLARVKSGLLFSNMNDRSGAEFVKYAEEMVRGLEIDLLCIDPLLSYVGDDISNQKIATEFLRHNLLPAMKSTGVMVAVVHHTGKPPKERTALTNSDLSYSGIGSSELVNWARAIFCIVGTADEKVFELRIAKRGSRAGMVNQFTGAKTDRIHISHNEEGEGLFWKQVRYEEPEEDAPRQKSKGGGGKRSRQPDVTDYVNLLPAEFIWADIPAILRKDAAMDTHQIKTALRDLRMSMMFETLPNGKVGRK